MVVRVLNIVMGIVVLVMLITSLAANLLKLDDKALEYTLEIQSVVVLVTWIALLFFYRKECDNEGEGT